MRRIYGYMLLLCKEQKGAVKILVALSMFMLIGFTAFVVDVGILYYEKSSLQKSLDAAVLGGAQLLKVSEAEAEAVAIELASQNGFPVREDEVTTTVTTEEISIEINKTVNKELFFARVLGFQSTDVGAAARAEIKGSLIKASGVIPVGLESKDFKKGVPYALNKKPGEGNSGNYSYLAIDGKGAGPLGLGIKNGGKAAVEIGQLVLTEPGQNWGDVEDGFDHRIKSDQKNLKCSSFQTADNSCNRVVIMPIIKTIDVNGRKDVKIIGFAAFWIDSISKHETTGRFIDFVTGGTFGPGDDGYGIYGVKLVK